VVDVDEHQRQHAIVALRALGLLGQALVEGAAIGQRGQRVGESLRRQALACMGVGHGDARELGEAGDPLLVASREGARCVAQRDDHAPAPAVGHDRRRDAVLLGERVAADGDAAALGPRAVAKLRAQPPGRVGAALSDRQHARAGAPPCAQRSVLVVAGEAQHVAAVGAQQRSELLGDDREEDLGIGLGRDRRGDALQRRLLAGQRARLRGAAAQSKGVAALLDRQPREMDRTLDDDLVARLGRSRGTVVERERPQHGTGAGKDRRRPAGAQAVGCGDLGMCRGQGVAGDVQHDHGLAAIRGAGADAAALGDLDAVERAREAAWQARRRDVAQHAGAARAFEQQDRGEHPGRVRLCHRQQLGQRVSQGRARRDQLEHVGLAVAPALLAVGHRAGGEQLELGRREVRELLQQRGVVL